MSYKFKLTDDIEKDFAYDISPKNNFFIRLANESAGEMEIFSRALQKNEANKIYEEKIVVFNSGLVQEKKINVSVIETNNPPKVEEFGAVTLELSHKDTFNKNITASDIEDGNENDGVLNLELVFSSGNRFFDIEHKAINIIPTKENLGYYEIFVCAKDAGIMYDKKKVLNCGENSILSKKTCSPFYLTITDINRKPIFVETSPNKTKLDVFGSEKIRFNVKVFDADGTKPLIYWYVDDSLKKKKFGALTDEFEYTFGCENSGAHRIEAVISDGLANNSIEWEINVRKGVCGVNEIEQRECKEKWGCQNWNLCQNTEQSFAVGVIKEEDKLKIKN